MLLHFHALRNDVTTHSLLASLNSLTNQLIVFFTLLLVSDQLAALPYSIHEVCLEKIIKGVQVKAFVQELEIDIFG